MNEKHEMIIAALTFEEKVQLLAGQDMWNTFAIDRLGIPQLTMSDGPNGVRGSGGDNADPSASFPIGAAMGATWHPELIESVGAALALEAKKKGAHVLLAPTVNMHRAPLAGRNFECFSEDPFLTSKMAGSYIRGVQQGGVSACVKHYVGNEQEFHRTKMSSEINERTLREIYLPPFEAAVKEAKSWALMTAYNKVNGTWVSESGDFLLNILKDEWEFDGLVISDWYGTYSPEVPANGVDLEMPGPARWMAMEHVQPAIERGDLTTAALDDKIRRLLRTLERVGAFETEEDVQAAPDNQDELADLIRKVGGEAIVLLKNERNLLPLDLPEQSTIAVIGVNASETQFQGGGSSRVTPHYVVSPLEGIRSRAGETTQVTYSKGAPVYRMPPALKPEWLTDMQGQAGQITLEYFDNLTLAGEIIHSESVESSYLTWYGESGEHFDPDKFSVRASAQLKVPESGEYEFTLVYVGQCGRILLDGVLLYEQYLQDDTPHGGVNWDAAPIRINLKSGQDYTLVFEYETVPLIQWRAARLGCAFVEPHDPVDIAVQAAKEADVAIVVVGLTSEWEAEAFDRVDMRLPKRQNEMIEKIAAVNPNTVVVMNAGSPIEMPWADQVAGILQLWYLGQEQGNALADILFGDINPSGKLPTTFPVRIQDNPAYINFPGENDKVHYGEGLFIGYRYYDAKRIAPRFPFGFGLSYTKFEFSDLSAPAISASGDDVLVRLRVENVGQRFGQEVIQLYIRDVKASVSRPEKELKGFVKVALNPLDASQIEFNLTARDFSFYSEAAGEWVLESGEFELLVGSSSRNIHLRTTIQIK